MRFYRISSAILAVVFSLVGFCFLWFPSRVIVFFNDIGRLFHAPEAPVHGAGFYGILACAYMVMVTYLAALMAVHPADSWFPKLLSRAKAASALLSVAIAVFHRPALVYLANGIVDGAIALFVLWIASRNPELSR